MLKGLVELLIILTAVSAVTEAFAGEDGTGRFLRWLIALIRLAAVAAAISEVIE